MSHLDALHYPDFICPLHIPLRSQSKFIIRPTVIMADAEVATKAPESDAQEDTPTTTTAATTTTATTTASDAPAPDQPSEQPKLGEHCVTDRPTRSFTS